MRRLLAALILGAIAWAVAAAPPRAIEKEVVVAATPDQVWDAWTTRAGVVSFFAPDAEVDARVGGAFHVFINPFAEPGAKGADDMRFMALQPKRMLSFDWNAPPSIPEIRKQRTFVMIRIEPVDATSTRVTLYHTGWGDGADWDQAYAYFDRAWGNVLANLKKRFETGPVDWTEWLARLRRAQDAAPVTK